MYCPLCDGVCSGHAGKTVETQAPETLSVERVKFRDHNDDSVRPDNGSFSKQRITGAAGDQWLAKFDPNTMPLLGVNEYMTMSLLDQIDVKVAETGVGIIDVNGNSRSVLYSKIINTEDMMIDGFDLLKNSSKFNAVLAEFRETTTIDYTHDEEFNICANNLTVQETAECYVDAGLENSHDLFKFIVAGSLVNHFDNHHGNFGFVTEQDSRSVELSPVYDVSNMAMYQTPINILADNRLRDGRLVLSADGWRDLGEALQVDDWKDIVREMTGKLRSSLANEIDKVKQLPWLNDLSGDHEEFLQRYHDTVMENIELSETKVLMMSGGGKSGFSELLKTAGAWVMQVVPTERYQSRSAVNGAKVIDTTLRSTVFDVAQQNATKSKFGDLQGDALENNDVTNEASIAWQGAKDDLDTARFEAQEQRLDDEPLAPMVDSR